MNTPEIERAVSILYRAYEDVAHDMNLTLLQSISTRRTIRNAIRYLTIPQSAVFRDHLLNTNRRKRHVR